MPSRARTPARMNLPPTSLPAAILLGGAALGVLLHFLALVRLRAHLRTPPRDIPSTTPPLTLWRAVKPEVPHLGAKLDALAQSSRPEDQILLGADAGSDALAACVAFRERHPNRAIDVIACAPDRAPNPKISKFIQMTPRARHPHWLLTDSEAMPDADFIESFRREWSATGADVLTSGYRFTGLRTPAQVLDAAPALLTLWPGLMLAGKIDFTLGACTGVSEGDIKSLGGWDALGADLAEDHRLGAVLSANGRRVQLSRCILTLESDPCDWRDCARHLHRVAVTYRSVAPAGALGMPLLQCVGLILAAVVTEPACWISALALLSARIAAASTLARMLGFRIPALPLTASVAPVFESFLWLAAWLPLPVWWSGRWRRISWRGRFR